MVNEWQNKWCMKVYGSSILPQYKLSWVANNCVYLYPVYWYKDGIVYVG
jgi:hypothetical protein